MHPKKKFQDEKNSCTSMLSLAVILMAGKKQKQRAFDMSG
jgi:hypothetical protein